MNARDQDEQTVAYNVMLNSYHFPLMQRMEQGSHGVEIVFSPKCNLACKYCYVKKYWHDVYDEAMFDVERSLENTRKLLKWMVSNGIRSKLSIFTGELFAQSAGYRLLDTILEFYRETSAENRIHVILVPTNFTFLCSDVYTQKVEHFISAFNEIGIYLVFSASFDGKYMEDNRPFAGNLDIDLNVSRDDAYYDKVFQFLKKYNFGLHPMVYSKGIERWRENHQWFMSMIAKHKLPLKDFYLLQVRNAEWNKESLQGLYDFLRYLLRYDFEHAGNSDVTKYVHDLTQSPYSGYNILKQPLIEHRDGLTCSIQQSLIIRAADLKIFPCHRTMYPHMQVAHMEDDGNDSLTVIADKAALGITINGCSFKSFPVCISCPMKAHCVGPCLGSNYETNRDLFVPIPSVCRMQYTVLRAVVDGLDEIGATEEYLKTCTRELAQSYRIMREIIKEGRTENG